MGKLIDSTYYTYNDVTIIPSKISRIRHRSECSPYDKDGKLPLFTAPMDTVVDKDNFGKFEMNGIHAILPRTFSLEERIEYSLSSLWAAYSLNEFEDVFCKKAVDKDNEHKMEIKALIDVANGHMEAIIDLVTKAKEIYGDRIVIMVGNIANPFTYEEYAKCGVDYIRCGIGGGNGCLSTSNLGIHMPMASLIYFTANVKESLSKREFRNGKKLPYIIADGGIRNYSDIIKALALGADYVMCGSIFSKMLESAAPKSSNSDEWYKLPLDTDIKDLENVHKEGNAWCGKYNGKPIFLGDLKLKFYGMASRDGQIALNGKKTKTSEGCSKTFSVEYTMDGWTENFRDYLSSAMSYVGARDLDTFRKDATLVVNSQNAVNVVNK